MKTILAPTLRRDKPWLATWLQGRRRKRLAAAVVVEEPSPPEGVVGEDGGAMLGEDGGEILGE